MADALKITSREVERRIEGWPSIKDYFGENTRIHKIIICNPKMTGRPGQTRPLT